VEFPISPGAVLCGFLEDDPAALDIPLLLPDHAGVRVPGEGRACAQRYKQICIGCTYAVCLYEHACTCAYMSMHTCVPTCVLCLQGHVCMRECTCLCASSMLVLILPGGVQYCSRLPSEVCKAHEMQTEEHCFFSSVCIKCSAPFEGLGRRKGSTCSRP